MEAYLVEIYQEGRRQPTRKFLVIATSPTAADQAVDGYMHGLGDYEPRRTVLYAGKSVVMPIKVARRYT